ncbi:MAG: acyltransferase family protein [Treponemataceae bacterium]
MPSKQVSLYDWIRLFATIFVVVGHSSYIVIPTVWGGVDYVLPSEVNPLYNSFFFAFLRRLSGWVYGFHMPLFFVLSGAVLNIKPLKKFDSIVVQKFYRLIVPFFVYGLFFMLPVKYLSGFYEKQNFIQAVKVFCYGEESGHLWFLTSLFWCILTFVSVKKILDFFKIDSYFILLIISFMIQFYSGKIKFSYFGFNVGLAYIFYFAVGFSFEKIRSKIENLSNFKIWFIFIFLSILSVLNSKLGFLPNIFMVFSRILWTFFLSLIFTEHFKKIYNSKIMKVILKNLFYVYIFHDPLEYVILKFYFSYPEIFKFKMGIILYYFLRIIGVCVISIILGEFVAFLKRKLQMLSILKLKHKNQ